MTCNDEITVNNTKRNRMIRVSPCSYQIMSTQL
uniref:Uncharacterized protein n=1 Tax=Rhizophora mucronata TaxID=61149 RepID=A0A2P2NXE7_RHIMU